MNREANDKLYEILNQNYRYRCQARTLSTCEKKNKASGYLVLEGSVKTPTNLLKFNKAMAKETMASKDGDLNQNDY